MKIPDLIDWLKVNASTAIDYGDALLQAGDIVHSAHNYYTMSDSQMRLKCGEMTAQEIRTVRAVLGAVLRGDFY
jgi:hypothetical protein